MRGIKRGYRRVGAWLLLLFSLAVYIGCGNTSQEGSGSKATESKKLCVYLYEDFPVGKAKKLCKELKKYFPDVELMKTRLPLPEEAFIKERNRYRGTGLLDDLRKLQDGNVVLGLTNKIICTSNELSPTFGIMGISYLKSGLCVASTVIPKSGTQQKDENFIKLTLHELGHSYGLPHCPDQKCYMVDAQHRMKLPQTTGFCEQCSAFLKSAGISTKGEL
ncbi:MAG: hypothetical protein K2J82_07530 [Muribaculaceae bacterium]|nr:hypothetical protein [Muribaculaceae bacterium]MDE6754447.1 hypothetical protein [Muribaculaceae bacterium]